MNQSMTMGSNVRGYAPPADVQAIRSLEVLSELSFVEESLSELHGMLGTLEKRLMPVSRLPAPQETGGQEPSSTRSDIGRRLEAVKSKLHLLCRGVRDMEERLEV